MRKYSKHRNYTKTYFFAQDRQKTLFFCYNRGCPLKLAKTFDLKIYERPTINMRSSKKILSLLLTILFLLSVSNAYAKPIGTKASSETQSVSFIHWSDIHLGDSHTPRSVWDEAFAAGRSDDLASFYILSGDLVDNKKLDNLQFNNRVADFCSSYLEPLVKEGKPVLVTYGNNDFYINYNTDPENMRPTMDLWRKAMGDQYYLDELGNGVYPERMGGITWITLNSLIFSPINSCPPDELKSQRERTLSWLEAALSAVPDNNTAVIVCHVPPCTDAYNHKSMWDDNSLKTFHKIVSNIGCHVIVTSGHTHRNELHTLCVSDIETVPIVIVGSIAQKYGYYANYRRTTWEFNKQTGLAENLSWDLKYIDPEKGCRTEVVEGPTLPKTWLDFRRQIAEDDEAYKYYLRDFYSCEDNWSKLISDQKLRQELVEEVFVNTGLEGCDPAVDDSDETEEEAEAA